MSDKVLHIITHDVPWPADFGGVMDLFYKIKTLHQEGVSIHLHCFVKNRPPQAELNKYCQSVHYYQRKKVKGISFRLPYIVSSRINQELEDRLLQDQHPILIEGVHCSHLLLNKQFLGRKILLRLHNTEFEYYHHLALLEKQPIKRLYYQLESFLLKRYEKKIANSVSIAAVSEQDVQIYHTQLGASKIFHLPVFIPFTHADGKPGQGSFCLYHGNLSINENEQAAVWLLQEVFNKIKIPFVIAGKQPSQKLEILAHQQDHTCLVADPSDKELHDMIAKAQLNILPSFNGTGVKLKLINALYNGRHCLVNKAGVEGSGLEDLCSIATDAESFAEAITQLYYQPYDAMENEIRQEVLSAHHNNQQLAEKLIDFFWQKL
jgi:glycosyltransferase involved in cell wall biosynthesis